MSASRRERLSDPSSGTTAIILIEYGAPQRLINGRRHRGRIAASRCEGTSPERSGRAQALASNKAPQRLRPERPSRPGPASRPRTARGSSARHRAGQAHKWIHNTHLGDRRVKVDEPGIDQVVLRETSPRGVVCPPARDGGRAPSLNDGLRQSAGSRGRISRLRPLPDGPRTATIGTGRTSPAGYMPRPSQTAKDLAGFCGEAFQEK